MTSLLVKRASASRSSGEWNDDDYDVLADGAVVDRIFEANAAPVGRLSNILHREPVVAGGRFRGRTAVVTQERRPYALWHASPAASNADDPIVF